MMDAEVSDLLKNKDLIESFLKRKTPGLSAFSFVSIFSWKDFFTFELKMIEDHLCIFAKDKLGCFMYLPPLGGNMNGHVIESCFDLMYEKNQGKGVSRIDNVPEDGLKWFEEGAYSLFEKSGEYIYRREDTAALKGNAFKSKRSSYNRFVKAFPHEFLPFEEKMKEECLQLYASWAKERKRAHQDPVYLDMLEQNRLVHKGILEYYRELDVTGRVVKIDGKIKAYSFGFALDADTFCILFEIADLSFKGLPAYIFKEFCGDEKLRRFTFINVMDDFGLENIKQTKLSFKPVRMVSSYAVSRK